MELRDNQYLTDIISSAPIGIYIINAQTLVAEAFNDKFTEIAGKPREVILNKRFGDIFPEAEERYGTALREVLTTGNAFYTNEVELKLTRNGKEEPVILTFFYSPVKDISGVVTKVAVWVLENTQQVKSMLAIKQLNDRLTIANNEVLATNEELIASNEQVLSANEKLVETQNLLRKLNIELQGNLDQLSRSEQFLNRFIMEAPAGLALMRGSDYTYRIHNAAYQAILPGRQLTGRSFFDAVPELKGTSIEQTLFDVYHAGIPHNFAETLVPLSDYEGGPTVDRYFTFNYLPWLDEKGNVDGILNLAFEVTDQVKAKQEVAKLNEALLSTNAQLEASTEATGFLLKLSDILKNCLNPLEVQLQAANALGKYLFADRVGYAEVNDDGETATITKNYTNDIDSLEGTFLMDDYGPEMTIAFKEGRTVVRNDIVNDPKLTNEEKEAHRVLQLGATLNLPLVKAGKLIAILFVHYKSAHEFTEKEISLIEEVAERTWLAAVNARTEEALRKSEEKYRTLFDSIDEGFCVLEAIYNGELVVDVRYIETNQVFEKQTGLINAKGRTAIEMLGSIDPFWLKTYQNILETGEPSRFEQALEEIGRWFNVFASKIGDKDSKLIAVVFDDITDRVKSDLMKNDFIGMVSHELKTPITSLNAYLQMLQVKARKAGDAFTHDALERSVVQVKKMTIMINGFLNVSRLESGKILIDFKRFDMALLMKEIEEESVVTITSHHIVFAPVEETFVNADRDKIGNVVNNLISNAVKYSANGSTINVACIIVGHDVQVYVKDQGIGINANDIDKLFDRYFRTDTATKSSTSGFGIGLYLSAEIIKRHNGKIWVESTLGIGSIFYFSIPKERKN